MDRRNTTTFRVRKAHAGGTTAWALRELLNALGVRVRFRPSYDANVYFAIAHTVDSRTVQHIERMLGAARC